MSTVYPGQIDSFINPTPNDYEDVLSHAGQHTNANDAITAIENVLGTTAGTGVLNDVQAGQKAVAVTPPTQGDLLYFGTTWEKLALGSAGQFLTTDGTTPSWGSAGTSGGGGILTPEQFGPSAFGINYRISTSASGGTLNVSLLGLNGSAPSSTNPLYLRAGNTVGSITSPLNISLSPGTSYFNSGASESAAQQIDYFLYISFPGGTPSIGMSRIPYAVTYSNFNGTSSNEKYGAFTTIPGTADSVEVIGRFNATLSAGTAYTWTIPSPSIVINRPIYETRWLTYTPTYSATSPMTWGTISPRINKYKISYVSCNVILGATGITGGTASNGLEMSVPFSINEPQFYSRGGCSVKDTTSSSPSMGGFIYNPNLTSFAFIKYDGSNYGLGSGREANGNILYSIN